MSIPKCGISALKRTRVSDLISNGLIAGFTGFDSQNHGLDKICNGGHDAF